MRKPFEELTIADDSAKQCTSVYIVQLRVFFRKLATAQFPCHPWQIMEDEALCKTFLELPINRHIVISTKTQDNNFL